MLKYHRRIFCLFGGVFFSVSWLFIFSDVSRFQESRLSGILGALNTLTNTQ